MPPSVSSTRKLSPNVFVYLNDIGIALYEKFGFKIEGTHRRYAFRNGEYADAYSMARVRD